MRWPCQKLSPCAPSVGMTDSERYLNRNIPYAPYKSPPSDCENAKMKISFCDSTELVHPSAFQRVKSNDVAHSSIT
jgi:hypothetical protein